MSLLSPEMRRVSAGLRVRSVTPPLQPSLGQLHRSQLVMVTSLEAPELLPQQRRLPVHMLQLVSYLELGPQGLTDPLPGSEDQDDGCLGS